MLRRPTNGVAKGSECGGFERPCLTVLLDEGYLSLNLSNEGVLDVPEVIDSEHLRLRHLASP